MKNKPEGLSFSEAVENTEEEIKNKEYEMHKADFDNFYEGDGPESLKGIEEAITKAEKITAEMCPAEYASMGEEE